MHIKHQACCGPAADVRSVPDTTGERMALQGSWSSDAPVSSDTCDPVRRAVPHGFTAEESQDESQGWRGEVTFSGSVVKFLVDSPLSALHDFLFYWRKVLLCFNKY